MGLGVAVGLVVRIAGVSGLMKPKEGDLSPMLTSNMFALLQ